MKVKVEFDHIKTDVLSNADGRGFMKRAISAVVPQNYGGKIADGVHEVGYSKDIYWINDLASLEKVSEAEKLQTALHREYWGSEGANAWVVTGAGLEVIREYEKDFEPFEVELVRFDGLTESMQAHYIERGHGPTSLFVGDVIGGIN